MVGAIKNQAQYHSLRVCLEIVFGMALSIIHISYPNDGNRNKERLPHVMNADYFSSARLSFMTLAAFLAASATEIFPVKAGFNASYALSSQVAVVLEYGRITP
ncbi:hypothetical protein D3C74_358140 [compost metagenome]